LILNDKIEIMKKKKKKIELLEGEIKKYIYLIKKELKNKPSLLLFFIIF